MENDAFVGSFSFADKISKPSPNKMVCAYGSYAVYELSASGSIYFACPQVSYNGGEQKMIAGSLLQIFAMIDNEEGN